MSEAKSSWFLGNAIWFYISPDVIKELRVLKKAKRKQRSMELKKLHHSTLGKLQFGAIIKKSAFLRSKSDLQKKELIWKIKVQTNHWNMHTNSSKQPLCDCVCVCLQLFLCGIFFTLNIPKMSPSLNGLTRWPAGHINRLFSIFFCANMSRIIQNERNPRF